MISKRYFVFAVLACALFARNPAFAGDGGDPGKANTISWDDFKYRCSDAKDKPLNEQGKPEHIRVQCTNVEREFVPGEPGSVALDASRHVVTTILSDKFDVAAMGKDYPLLGTAKGQAACLRYKEVERTIQVEKSLSCEDMLAIKGDITDYCAGSLDMVKGTSPKLIETHDTGNVHDTCGGAAVTPGKLY